MIKLNEINDQNKNKIEILEVGEKQQWKIV